MIAWLCALRCEAQPILTRLQARRVPSALGFRIYRKDNAIVAITGGGPERASAATGALLREFSEICELRNVGICGGTPEVQFGDVFTAEAVAWDGQLYPLRPWPGMPARPLTTVRTPQTEGVETLVEMETGAIAAACGQLPLSVLKVVSDLADGAVITAEQASKLVGQALAVAGL